MCYLWLGCDPAAFHPPIRYVCWIRACARPDCRNPNIRRRSLMSAHRIPSMRKSVSPGLSCRGFYLLEFFRESVDPAYLRTSSRARVSRTSRCWLGLLEGNFGQASNSRKHPPKRNYSFEADATLCLSRRNSSVDVDDSGSGSVSALCLALAGSPDCSGQVAHRSTLVLPATAVRR